LRIVKRFGKDIAPGTLRLCLCDQNPDMVDAWIDQFRNVDAIEIAEGSLLDTEAAALLSPANSFGDMGGGLDKAIDDFYRGTAQDRLQAAIREHYYGELPVGVGLVIPMGDAGTPSRRFPFLVAAPTMRIPSVITDTDTINAGALVAVLRHNAAIDTPNQTNPQRQPIRILSSAGLGTGVGGMDVGVSAEQMRAAYDSVIGGEWRDIVHPAQAPYAFGGRRRLRRDIFRSE